MVQYKINYTLKHANSALVDESGDTPLVFEVGDGQLAPCLERCVLEAKIGKLQTFLLTADEAFGQNDEAAVATMKRGEFAADMPLELDAAVEFKTPAGESYVGCIEKIEDNNITVNFNHPLAGCDIVFQMKILQIIQ